MNPSDFVRAARTLAQAGQVKPRQVYLRRAVSTTYYAMFHALARCCADMFVGGRNADRSGPAWQQVYRALDHAHTKNQCKSRKITQFPAPIQDFANLFVAMQDNRHKADYDPFETFSKSEAIRDIIRIEAAIAAFDNTSVKDKRAFAAFVLLKARN